MNKEDAFILWFDQLRNEDVQYVGGKNASLGEMYALLTNKGVKVPNGFAVTAKAYRYFLEKANLQDKIRAALKGLNTKNIKNLQARGKKVRDLILKAELPNDLKHAIRDAYHHLSIQYGKATDVAVRSSATAEDLPDASFAGQQETYLNISGNEALIDACKKCFASLFTDRAISYRVDKHFDHFTIALSIGVQKMVRSDKAGSGVMFTLDTESGFKDAILINSSYGLGENIVKGTVNPDEYLVFKPTLLQGKNAIISKQRGDKKIKMIYTSGKKGVSTKNIPTTKAEQSSFMLTDKEVLELAKWGSIIENHYSEKAGKWKPMDIEWAKDGRTKELFIVQARPETVQSQKDKTFYEEFHLKERGKVLAVGHSVGAKIGQGKANIIKNVKDIHKFKPGEVLVTEITDPDWEPIMKIAAAIVTEKGGRTSHAAIVSRELGIPAVVGTNTATSSVKQGQPITVSAAEGETGFVYEGLLKFQKIVHDLTKIPKTRTKIMMNIGNPDEAFANAHLPNDGVGLAREEFIVNSYIKIHPQALLNFDKLKDKKAKATIAKLTQGYKNKAEYFIERLSHGIARIGAAYYPKDVIVRLSDFKTNEYANLIGGKEFEPKEENPMLGWRGASRYYREGYKHSFALECEALKRVRNDMGLTNVKIMVPFCRTPEEGRKVIEEMKMHGLIQGDQGLEIYVMCEIPSNVILADEFADIFDGFSIGSNDLTQLTLGLDRDSELVSDLYDERDPAVEKLIAQVIKVAKRRGKKIGICGQAPSDYPEFAQFLVREGIDSISLNPDTIVKTRLKIAEQENS